MGCGTLLKSSTRMTAVPAMTLTKVSLRLSFTCSAISNHVASHLVLTQMQTLVTATHLR